MQVEMPLGQYHRMTYPLGQPTQRTLRRWINDGVLPGKSMTVNSKKRYYVYVGPTTGDTECDNILAELGG